MEEDLRTLLEPTLRSMGVRGQVRDAQVVDAFAEVVGAALAGHCRAQRMERDTLVVGTTNTALAHQLHLDSLRVIDGMNQRLGTGVVKRLRFVPLES